MPPFNDPGDEYMANVLNGQQSLESFEADHLTAAINRDKTISQPMRDMLVNKVTAMKNISIRPATQQNGQIKTVSSQAQYNGGGMAGSGAPAAQFSLIVKRNSSKIATPLPVIFFMSDFQSTQYQTVVSNFIAQISPGTTLASVVIVNNNALRWTFTNGANTDQVDIFGDTNTYPAILQSMNTTYFETLYMRMKVQDLTVAADSDNLAQSQFNQFIVPTYDTNFGKYGGQRCPLTDCQPPNQFLKNVIDIPWAQFPLNPREGWMLPVINAPSSDHVVQVSIAHPVKTFSRTSA